MVSIAVGVRIGTIDEVLLDFSVLVKGILPLHLDEHVVHFLHLGNSLLILLQVLCLLCRSFLVSATALRLLHQRSRISPCLLNIFDCRVIDVV